MKRSKNEPVFWAVLGTLVLQLWLCGFFKFGAELPMTGDTHLGNFRQWASTVLRSPAFLMDYWLGIKTGAQPFGALQLASALLSPWLFFTAWYPLFGALAVWGLYLLGRELGFGKGAATLGGLAWGWQGMLVGNIASGHFAPGPLVAALPLACWAALRAVRRSSWAWAVVAGGLTGEMVLELPDRGGLASAVVGALFLVALCVLDRGEPRRMVQGLFRLAAMVGVAAVIAWPGVSAIFRSAVTGSGAGVGGSEAQDPAKQYAWATQWSLAPEEAVVFAAPGFLGWRTGFPGGPYWGRVGRSEEWSAQQPQAGMRNFQLDIVTMGTIPLLLGLVGAWALWRRRTIDGADLAAEDRLKAGLQTSEWSAEQRIIGRFFVVAWVVCLLLALGKYAPFFKWVYALPYMSSWRNPLKFITPGNFCLVVLAVYGVDALARLAAAGEGAAAVRGLVKRALWFAALAMGAGLAMALAAPEFFTGGMAGEGYSEAEVAAASSTLGKALFVASACAALLAFAVGEMFDPDRARRRQWSAGQLQRLWRFATEPGRMATSVAVFAGIVNAGQMFWVLSHYIDMHEAARMYGMNALIRHLKGTGEPVRVKVFNQDPVLHNLLSRVFPYHGIHCVDIPATSRTPDDYAEFFGALQNNPLRLWDLAGVRYVAAQAQFAQAMQQQMPGFAASVGRIAGYRATGSRIDNLTFEPSQAGAPVSHVVFDVKRYLPKASIVPAVEVLPDKAAVLQRLADPAWEPRRSVLVEAGAADAPRAGIPGTARGEVFLRRYDGRRIEADVRCDAPAVLLINDKFDDDWRASINGARAPLFRADHILRGLVVPAGESRVALDYRPPVGAVYVNLLGWCAVAAAAWSVRRRK